MKQLPPYPRAYIRPGPKPKLPVGLEELMEGLTREVLKHNPTDVYRFAADHMQKLLHVRNAHLKSQRTFTLEEKIKIAQKKIKERALQRIKNVDNELKKSAGNITAGPAVSDINEITAEVNERDKSELIDETVNIDMEYINANPRQNEKHLETDLVEVNDVGTTVISEALNEIKPEQVEKTTEIVTNVSDNETIGIIVQNESNNMVKEVKEINAEIIDDVPIISDNEKEKEVESLAIKAGSVLDNIVIETTNKEQTTKDDINANTSEIILKNEKNAADTNSLNANVTSLPEQGSNTNLRDIHSAEIKHVNGNVITEIPRTETISSDPKTNDINKSELGIIRQNSSEEVNQKKVVIENNSPVPDNDKMIEIFQVDKAVEGTEKEQEVLNKDKLGNIVGTNDHNEVTTVEANSTHILSNPQKPTDIIETEESINKQHPVDREKNKPSSIKESEEPDSDNFGEKAPKDHTENIIESTVALTSIAKIEDNLTKPANSSEDHGGKVEINAKDTRHDSGEESSLSCVADVIHAPIVEPRISVKENIGSSENVQSFGEIKDVKTAEQLDNNIDDQELNKVFLKVDENIIPSDTIGDEINPEDKLSLEVVPIAVFSENKDVIKKLVQSSDTKSDNENEVAKPMLLSVKSVESDNITENVTTDTDITIEKNSSIEENTNDFSSESNVDNNLPHSNLLKSQTPMDLETAAITIQKVFRTFMFKSRGSTLDDVPNYESSFDIPYMAIDNVEDDIEIKASEIEFSIPTLNKERRTLGISRMDTVLQTVNEEKSLSLSTDDSSLSSAATTIQAHVRGFLVRNRLNSNKSNSNSSLVNSADVDIDSQKNKTVLNIHIVPEGGQFMSRDESIGTSIDLPLDVSPRTTSFHSLGSDISERRKQLKREDAIQSVSPPSNNSGKLSEDVESVKEFPLAHNETVTEVEAISSDNYQDDDGYSTNKEIEPLSSETTPTKSTTADTVIEVTKNSEDEKNTSELDNIDTRRQRLTKMSSDEMDVVTPTSNTSPIKLMHSGEFHDVLLPTRISRNESSVVREFKSVLVYFLLWNK